MILNDTCDLKFQNVSYILFCPIIKFDIIVKEILNSYIAILKKEESNKRRKSTEEKLRSTIKKNLTKRLSELMNNKSKTSFFLPNEKNTNGNVLMIANIDRVSSLSIEFAEQIITYRKTGLKSPWRELLGYKMGYLFNRVATKNIEDELVSNLIDTKYQDFIAEIISRIIE